MLGPERGPIQQALDFGATAVVIPHIEGAAHAAAICAFGKFPPRGDRSFAGGRTAPVRRIRRRVGRRQDARPASTR